MKNIVRTLQSIGQIIEYICRSIVTGFTFLRRIKRRLLGVAGLIVVVLWLYPLLINAGNCFSVAWYGGNIWWSIFFCVAMALIINTYALGLIRLINFRFVWLFHIMGLVFFVISFVGFIHFAFWYYPSDAIHMSRFVRVAPDFSLFGPLILFIFFLIDSIEFKYFRLEEEPRKEGGWTANKEKNYMKSD